MKKALLLSGLLLVPLLSLASTYPNRDYWQHLRDGKQFAVLERMRTIFPTNPSGTEWIIPNTPTITNAPGGGVDIKNTANVPVGRKSVPITTARHASNAAVAGAAGGVLRNAARLGGPVVGAYAAATGIRDLLQAAEIYFAPDLFSQDRPLYRVDKSACSSATPTASDTTPYDSDQNITKKWATRVMSGQCALGWWIDGSAYGWNPNPFWYGIRYVPVDPYYAPKIPLTTQEVTDLIAQKQATADALQDLINQDKEHQRRNGIDPFGYVGPTLETSQPVASGPSSLPSSSSTSQKESSVSPGTTQPVAPGTPGAQPATQTTTTTTTNNITYNNNVVNNTITTTTTITITNNITNETSPPTTDTEETNKPDPEEEDPPVDMPLGEVPKLYERKYPEGLVGIWNQKSQQIKESAVFTLAAELMPTGLTTGNCPSWPINLDFAWWASYGERDVAPPCWIWDVAKTIIIISALLLARSLIFGG